MNTFLAAVEVGNNSMGDAFMTGLILLVVVFAALVALSLVIKLFGKLGDTSEKPSPKAAAPVSAAPKAVPAPVPAAAPVSTEDEDEVAAAIAAAVAMMAPAGVAYRVRRITPVGQRTRSEWAAAAARQNTMPF